MVNHVTNVDSVYAWHPIIVSCGVDETKAPDPVSWADALPADLKQQVTSLAPQTVDSMKASNRWSIYREAVMQVATAQGEMSWYNTFFGDKRTKIIEPSLKIAKAAGEMADIALTVTGIYQITVVGGRTVLIKLAEKGALPKIEAVLQPYVAKEVLTPGILLPSSSPGWASIKTLSKHFADHKMGVGAKTAEEYVQMAQQFFDTAKAAKLPTKIDSEGIIRIWDPVTRTFGSYNSNGTIKTFFKATSPRYFDGQPGNLVY